MQSCRVQSEGVKNESKGLQETGLPATVISYPGILHEGITGNFVSVWAKSELDFNLGFTCSEIKSLTLRRVMS